MDKLKQSMVEGTYNESLSVDTKDCHELDSCFFCGQFAFMRNQFEQIFDYFSKRSAAIVATAAIVNLIAAICTAASRTSREKRF